jgi:hypothetical protein
MKERIIRKMEMATLATLIASTMTLSCLMWCCWALSRLPNQDAQLSRIEALTNPLDWKTSALSLTMSRHEFAHAVTIGLVAVAVVLAGVLLLSAFKLVWLRRLAESEIPNRAT